MSDDAEADARALADLSGEVRIRRASDEAFAIEVGALRLAFLYFDEGDQVRRQVRGRPTQAQAEAAARIMARALREALQRDP